MKKNLNNDRQILKMKEMKNVSATIKIQDIEWECLLDRRARINVMFKEVVDKLVSVRIGKTEEKL